VSFGDEPEEPDEWVEDVKGGIVQALKRKLPERVAEEVAKKIVAAVKQVLREHGLNDDVSKVLK
jgi:hypothetical protein